MQKGLASSLMREAQDREFTCSNIALEPFPTWICMAWNPIRWNQRQSYLLSQVWVKETSLIFCTCQFLRVTAAASDVGVLRFWWRLEYWLCQEDPWERVCQCMQLILEQRLMQLGDSLGDDCYESPFLRVVVKFVCVNLWGQRCCK